MARVTYNWYCTDVRTLLQIARTPAATGSEEGEESNAPAADNHGDGNTPVDDLLSTEARPATTTTTTTTTSSNTSTDEDEADFV
jgi:hypothetical protein